MKEMTNQAPVCGLAKMCILIFAAVVALSAAGPLSAHHCKGKHWVPECDDPGGGGGGGDDEVDGSAHIPLSCTFADNAGDTILNDISLPYQDGMDKVRCETGATGQPNPSGLAFTNMTRGNLRNAVRKVDLVINSTSGALPPGVGAPAGNIDDMEDISIGVRAYAGTDLLDHPDIQSLTPGGCYDMALNIGLKGTSERFVFQMMAPVIPADFHQGIYCDLDDPTTAQTDDDIHVCLWPDLNTDGVADGYTVTTADTVDFGPNDDITPPLVSGHRSREMALCSNFDADGLDQCGGSGGSDLCHLLEHVQVKFTWHLENQ